MSHPKAHLKIVVAERKELSTEEKVGRYGLLERSEGRSTAEGMIEFDQSERKFELPKAGTIRAKREKSPEGKKSHFERSERRVRTAEGR
jgi:hypothetical protein